MMKKDFESILQIICCRMYGTCYHSDLACSGLKRTIYLILLEETGGKRACGKCGANTEVR